MIERLELLPGLPKLLVPDDAQILRLDRIVFNASVRGKGSLQKLGLRRQRDGGTIRCLAFAVDGLDGLIGELELVGDLRKLRAGGAFVLDLVAKVEDQTLGAIFENPLLEIGLRLLEGHDFARLDLGDAE